MVALRWLLWAQPHDCAFAALLKQFNGTLVYPRAQEATDVGPSPATPPAAALPLGPPAVQRAELFGKRKRHYETASLPHDG
eukprot:5471696-Pyramimonas_sp.AAC.1